MGFRNRKWGSILSGVPWIYEQSTGKLRWNQKLAARGYSGFGAGLNNPKLEHMRDVGPIPKGKWKISRPYNSKTKGPHVMALTPVGHDALGRTEFMIHGDNAKKNKSASNGCIILGPADRKAISASGDDDLEVVG